MRTRLPVLAAVCLISLLLAGCSLPEDGYNVGGQILLGDGTPVEGVNVGMTWYDHDVTITVTTDKAGWYDCFYLPLLKRDEFHLSPYHPAYSFSPGYYHFTNGLRGDRMYLDFTAIPVE